MTYFKSLIVFLAMAMFLVFTGCVSNDPVMTAEKLLEEEKVEIRETPQGEATFALPVDRYDKNYRDKQERGHLAFYSASPEEVDVYDEKFIKSYTGKYNYHRTKKERVASLTRSPNIEAKVFENFLIINGHHRKVTQVYLPKMNLLIHCWAHGTTGGHAEIIELILKTLEPKERKELELTKE